MIVYIDSASFSNATSVYLDELLTIIAPDGYYSDGSYYRKQVGGNLIDLLPCPNIDTVSITAVGETTATFNGNLINNGGDVNAVRGFVYGTSPNPTTANSVITDTVMGQGAYSLNVTGLASVVQYYVRAYTIVFGETIYGDELNFTTVIIVPCGQSNPAGGPGIEDLNVSLDSIGGVIIFLLDPQGFVDKLEIYHGLPQNGGVNKKATTSMTATTNDGIYDNYWSTPASNLEPNDTVLPVDQFIGTSKGVCPTRQTEFTADTGFSVPSMTIGGVTYDQIVWWKYTTADYLVNSIATIRITGGSSNTEWTALRLCF